MPMLTLDAQRRMAAHLTNAGWTVIPPARLRPVLSANRKVEQVRRQEPTPAPAPTPPPAPAPKKPVRKGDQKSVPGLIAGTNLHRLLLTLKNGEVLDTEQMSQRSGMGGRQSNRATELRQRGFTQSVGEPRQGTPRRYQITSKGRKALAELEE